MGFEPTTFSLARRRSTAEPRPRCAPRSSMGHSESYRERKGVSTRPPTTSSKPQAPREPRTQDARHKTQDTRHKTQDTRRRTQDTRHKTRAPEPGFHVLRFTFQHVGPKAQSVGFTYYFLRFTSFVSASLDLGCV